MRTFSLRRFSGRLLTVAALALVAAVGCAKADKKVTVKGTVSYKGQPLKAGILKFVGPNGAYSAASIQPDGTFIVTDVVPGEVKVGVMEAPQSSGSSSGGRSAPPKPPANPLPAKYREPETSGLKYTIPPSDTELKIDIP
jgi:hypothetical protein